MKKRQSKSTITDVLCTECGLCCDGTLLAEVELVNVGDVRRVEGLGLPVDEAEELRYGIMPLPCGGLNGTRCSVYQHRPHCCRTFECGLLSRVRANEMSVEEAVRRVKDFVNRVTRLKERLATSGVLDPELSLHENIQTLESTSEGQSEDTLTLEALALWSGLQSAFLDGDVDGKVAL